MDDGVKDFRRGKPQQQFYTPGSGPLKKTSQIVDIKMEKCTIENDHRDKDQDIHLNSSNKQQNYSNSSRSRKPEQQLYIPRSSGVYGDGDKPSHSTGAGDYSSLPYDRRIIDKHTNSGSYSRGNSARRDNHRKDNIHSDLNYNKNYRQVSEPRSTSPIQTHQNSSSDRNRDSRSMETSAGRQNAFSGGGKPPSGRRNSSGYPSDMPRQKFPVNLDNLAPRFRKKFLAEAGHQSLDSNDLNKDRCSPHLPPNAHYNANIQNVTPMWSQTLPSRGRGRFREEDRDKYMAQYMRNYDIQQSRRSTPSGSFTNLYDTRPIGNSEGHISEQSLRNLEAGSRLLTNSDNKNGCKSTHSTDELQKSNHQIETPPIVEPSQEIKVAEDMPTPKDNKEANDISSTNLIDITNLDWTEEVESNIKLEDVNDSSTSSLSIQMKPVQEVIKPIETQEPHKSGGRCRRRDKRSSSRSNRSSGKNSNNNNNQQQQQNGKSRREEERNRRDSGQYDSGYGNLRRERRDSHRSNISSTIGNSRDDLDRWRSLRSFSREHSSERKIVSQCNSRDASATRAASPRFNDGFRIPAPVQSSWVPAHQKSGGRNLSAERGRVSPAPSNTGGGGGNSEGSGKRSKRKFGRRKGRNSENTPAAHPHPPSNHSSNSTNWREEILESKKHNDRHHEPNRSKNAEKQTTNHSNGPANLPGLLVLPQNIPNVQNDHGRSSNQAHKTLFDHQNPSKPIIVQTSPGKADLRMDRGGVDLGSRSGSSRGYEAGDAQRAAKHRAVLQKVDRADAVLQAHMLRGPLPLADHWNDVVETRIFLQSALERLLKSDLKFCQSDNVEHHFWKILYYNFIEMLRKSLPQVSPQEKQILIGLINTIIEEGNVFFESLVQMLEKTYKFSTDAYINDNHLVPPKGLGYVGLALISVQKLFIFLGDLARYREQINETNNYAKSKLWYTKAQQINPKNGRPYNQLAILAIYARRKLDAVYYYMRSLMSSNPFQSARESLLPLFEESRKKYEAAERKRRAAREAALGTTDNSNPGSTGGSGRGLRREIWIRPSGGRTTTLRHDTRDQDLANMTSVELNKNFITSYLNVHGKLITKIGMETFHESAALMLKQFRALLHQQPLPTTSARLLQLTALNIFAVETTTGTQKDGSGDEVSRSAWLQSALGVSLLMFGALLERCCALLPEPPSTEQHTDALLLLPAIKVWSDWMLCHSSVWNPPPTLEDFDLGIESDPWDWLAKFMNTLEALEDKSIEFESESKEGYVPVRLAEDVSLAGFTPLMYMEPTPSYVRSTAPHVAEHALRMRKLLFFGTEYLVGVEPQVLRLECPPGESPFYASAVQKLTPRRIHNDDPLHELSEDSEGEESTSAPTSATISEANDTADNTDEATRRLLRRKEQLEVRRAHMERRKQRMQEILRGGWVSVEVEVRPRWLVPDTNCFIEHLALLQRVVTAQHNPYLLAVPLVVVTELEGLSKCARVGPSAVAALEWLNSGTTGIKYVTSRGSLLTSSAFTAENASPRTTNDDRVLAAALNLHTNLSSETVPAEGATSDNSRCVREVVLLTDDRNLRVKALAAEMPARDLPAFLQWASLPPLATNTP